jgi:hypothetical protein
MQNQNFQRRTLRFCIIFFPLPKKTGRKDKSYSGYVSKIPLVLLQLRFKSKVKTLSSCTSNSMPTPLSVTNN